MLLRGVSGSGGLNTMFRCRVVVSFVCSNKLTEARVGSATERLSVGCGTIPGEVGDDNSATELFSGVGGSDRSEAEVSFELCDVQ